MGRPRKAAPDLYWLERDQVYALTLNGTRHYLGSDRDAAELKRAELLLQAREAGRRPAGDPLAKPMAARTVGDVFELYVAGMREGMDARHLRAIGKVVGLVEALHADLPAADLSPLHVHRIRQQLATQGRARGYINSLVRVFKTIWRWAVSMAVVAGPNAHGVLALRAWEEGDGGRETPPRLPVDDKDVDKTLPHLPTLVRAMVQLLRLTGARPGELVRMRRRDVSTSADEKVEPLPGWFVGAPAFEGTTVWLYAPPRHKTRRKKKARIIAIGPKAQGVLRPWLEGLAPDDLVFTPVRSEAIRQAERRAARECPVYDSQERYRRDRKRDHPRRPPGATYTTNALDRVLARACEKAGTKWTLYQLRHRAGVLVADEFDEADAAALLGHAPGSNVTGTYTRARLGRLAELAARLG